MLNALPPFHPPLARASLRYARSGARTPQRRPESRRVASKGTPRRGVLREWRIEWDGKRGGARLPSLSLQRTSRDGVESPKVSVFGEDLADAVLETGGHDQRIEGEVARDAVRPDEPEEQCGVALAREQQAY